MEKQKLSLRKTISYLIKILIVFTSLGGVVIGLFTYGDAGYSNWWDRLLYFTTQSNIWIGVTMLLIILSPIFKSKNKEKLTRRLYILKYIFTVSITLTGLVFCCMLAPFADETYKPWSLTSLLTHVFTPALAIIDWFLDNTHLILNKKHIFASLIPPALYVAFAVILGAFGVDFGRGDTYPYFFLNFNSAAGLFGFAAGSPPEIGTVYWLVFLLCVILVISVLYAKLHPTSIQQRKLNKTR
ncbi:MAG: Pr6Pr family membrane protein [Clostridia bacterium]|nr:Pr6Pr family membrane protein [Clostridia bacterium]